MAQILPKMKMYLFICVISLLINIVAYVMSFAMNGDANLPTFVGSSLGSFFPVVDIISIAFLGFPEDVLALFLLFSGVLTAIKIWILAEIVASHIPTVNV